MNELISVKQLPIIEENLKAMAEQIDREVKEAMELAVTPETVKTVKEVRAGLNRQFKELEEQRKTVKKAILEPYDRFEEIYKKYVSVRFSDGDTELKRKINAVEADLKREKEADLRSYFRELADSRGLEWLAYERGGFNVTLSKSRTALHKEVDAFVGRVDSDVTAILAMEEPAEVMAEYKQSLTLGLAVETVRKRREAVERERQRQEAETERRNTEKERAEAVLKEAEEARSVYTDGPTVEEEPNQKEPEDPVRTLSFTVTAPISKLKELKRFLEEGGYEIG